MWCDANKIVKSEQIIMTCDVNMILRSKGLPLQKTFSLCGFLNGICKKVGYHAVLCVAFYNNLQLTYFI